MARTVVRRHMENPKSIDIMRANTWEAAYNYH